MTVCKTVEEIISNNLIVEIIKQIMKDIESDILIYQNEAQFQLDLAFRIRQQIDPTSGIEVLPEYFTMVDEFFKNTKSRLKKFYTDILIVDLNGNYIPIELKYKKKGMIKIIRKNDIDITRIIGHDGAQDLGRFDYLWDIHRIEQLTQKEIKTFPNNISMVDEYMKGKDKFICGYAVMITNDSAYWKKDKESDGCADDMTLNKDIKEIRWKNTKKGMKCITGDDSKSNRYYNCLMDDDDKVRKDVEVKYMPLKNNYAFYGEEKPIGENLSIIQSSNVDIITIKNYKSSNKKSLEIKAFVAKIK